MSWTKAYPYAATSNGQVNTAVLDRQIEDSAIDTGVNPLEGVSSNDATDVILIQFQDPLSAADELILDGVVAAHVGLPFVNPKVLRVEELPDTSDDSGNWITKLSAQVPVGGLPPGDYQITLASELHMDATLALSGMEARLRIDGATLYTDSWGELQPHTFSVSGTTVFRAGDRPMVDVQFRRIGAANPAHIAAVRVSLIFIAPATP